MPDIVTQILQQGGLGILAAAAAMWGYSERQAREKERGDMQKAAIVERDTYMRMVEKERGENQKLQTEIMRLATETSQTNALTRQTISDMKTSLEGSRRTRSAPK